MGALVEYTVYWYNVFLDHNLLVPLLRAAILSNCNLNSAGARAY
jgi:hypothetical protein